MKSFLFILGLALLLLVFVAPAVRNFQPPKTSKNTAYLSIFHILEGLGADYNSTKRINITFPKRISSGSDGVVSVELEEFTENWDVPDPYREEKPMKLTLIAPSFDTGGEASELRVLRRDRRSKVEGNASWAWTVSPKTGKIGRQTILLEGEIFDIVPYDFERELMGMGERLEIRENGKSLLLNDVIGGNKLRLTSEIALEVRVLPVSRRVPPPRETWPHEDAWTWKVWRTKTSRALLAGAKAVNSQI